jgi:hypothetical protein
MKKNKGWFGRILPVYFAAVLFTTSLKADAATSAFFNEYEIKAAFLYQFTKFTEWPAGPDQANEFSVCILGRDPFGTAINQILEEEVKGKPVVVKHYNSIDEGPAACHMLFISRSEKNRIKRILNQVRQDTTLTISDIPGFIYNGGMVNFVRHGTKIRFEINQKMAEQAGIKFSSKLLSLALRVI